MTTFVRTWHSWKNMKKQGSRGARNMRESCRNLRAQHAFHVCEHVREPVRTRPRISWLVPHDRPSPARAYWSWTFRKCSDLKKHVSRTHVWCMRTRNFRANMCIPTFFILVSLIILFIFLYLHSKVIVTKIKILRITCFDFSEKEGKTGVKTGSFECSNTPSAHPCEPVRSSTFKYVFRYARWETGVWIDPINKL